VIIAVAGPIGVGKSTVARALAARLGYRYLSAGEAFREMARRRGLSVLELNRLAEQDPDLDREVDRMQAELARAGSCVVESRLAGWMVDADLKVWLRAELPIRAARVAQRERIPVEAAERPPGAGGQRVAALPHPLRDRHQRPVHVSPGPGQRLLVGGGHRRRDRAPRGADAASGPRRGHGGIRRGAAVRRGETR